MDDVEYVPNNPAFMDMAKSAPVMAALEAKAESICAACNAMGPSQLTRQEIHELGANPDGFVAGHPMFACSSRKLSRTGIASVATVSELGAIANARGAILDSFRS